MDQPLPTVSPNRSISEPIKIYLVEVITRKVIPAATAAALSALTVFVAAHKEILESWGVTYGTWPLANFTASGPVIVIELDTVNAALWSLGAAGLTALIALIAHHTSAAIKGTPQSGGLRATDQ